MGSPIKRVTIVGGGTAGWLTALILNTHLNRVGKQRQRVAITLIESPRVPTVGVGESTIQNLKLTLRDVGINESDFFRRTNGSFKVGVQYADWCKSEGGAASRYFNPLNGVDAVGGFQSAYHFRKFGPHWLGASYGESILPNASLVARQKGPRPIGGPDYTWDLNYAYHIDAALFAEFMRDFAVTRGVEHLRDDVVDVLLDETGAIEALQLDQGGRYPVEFVIDCTGFRSLIWSRMGGEPFVSANNRLLNDRAIPVQLEHRDPKHIDSCTRVSGLGAGWVWRVPLYSRLGTGYVYSSAFRSDDEARAEFLGHLRANGDLAPEDPDPETRVIQMRIGYTRQPWIKNCVAIGLSSGFVEPLEATAIYTIDAAAHRLAMNFPSQECDPALIKSYNELATDMIEEIVDFLQANYVTSNRPEPYWLAARNDTVLSDWLRDKLELWRVRIPDSTDTHKRMLFPYSLYTNALLSNGYFTNIRYPLDDAIRLEDWQGFGQKLKSVVAQHTATLPGHYELLTSIRSGQSAPIRKNDPLAILSARR